MSGMQSPAGRGAAGRTRSQAQGPPQVQPPQVPQQQQPPDIVQLQAQVQQLLTQVQNQNNTIANLQQQQAAAATAPAPARFAVTPAAHATGFLDFDKKGDTILFKEATKSLYQDPTERYDLSPQNTQAFLNKVYDRGQHCNISVLLVPVDNNNPNGAKSNYCRHHATFDLEHLKTYARTFVGGQSRKTQDDKILCRLLQESLSESAYKIISTDRSAYTISGEECGLLMLKAILERSSVDTNTDPDILRDELTRAADKFVSLQCDVKKFNEWFMEKVEQLKQNGILARL